MFAGFSRHWGVANKPSRAPLRPLSGLAHGHAPRKKSTERRDKAFTHTMVLVDMAHTDRLDTALQASGDMAGHYGAKVTCADVTSRLPSSVARTPADFAETLKRFAAAQDRRPGAAARVLLHLGGPRGHRTADRGRPCLPAGAGDLDRPALYAGAAGAVRLHRDGPALGNLRHGRRGPCGILLHKPGGKGPIRPFPLAARPATPNEPFF